MDTESRLRYYLGSLYDAYSEKKQVVVTCKPWTEQLTFNKCMCVTIQQIIGECTHPALTWYKEDMKKYVAKMRASTGASADTSTSASADTSTSASVSTSPDSAQVLINYGDKIEMQDKPVLAKIRAICPEYAEVAVPAVILRLNTNNHLHEVPRLAEFDIPWKIKNAKLVWRGTPTGFGGYNRAVLQRHELVTRFHAHPNKNIDVKFVRDAPAYKAWREADPSRGSALLLGAPLTVQDMLRSKFLISVEGNDVATNLKWALASNSCVIMPRPTIVSWFMEDTLIPGVHYVEVQPDFSDLEEKYKWCLEHDDECRVIAENGKQFMKPFLNEQEEQTLNARVLAAYLETVVVKEEAEMSNTSNASTM